MEKRPWEVNLSAFHLGSINVRGENEPGYKNPYLREPSKIPQETES